MLIMIGLLKTFRFLTLLAPHMLTNRSGTAGLLCPLTGAVHSTFIVYLFVCLFQFQRQSQAKILLLSPYKAKDILFVKKNGKGKIYFDDLVDVSDEIYKSFSLFVRFKHKNLKSSFCAQHLKANS